MGRNPRGGRRREPTGGFTFVEVLAALIFLAVVVPAIVTALTLSNKASEVTERGAAAGELAENKLNEMLTADAWQNGSTMAGDCGADWPGYRWEMMQSPWTGGSVTSAGTGSAGTSGGSSGTDSGLSTGGTGSGTTTSNVGNTTLTELKVNVFFKVQGVERSVSLSTVVNSLASSSGTTTTSTGGGTP